MRKTSNKKNKYRVLWVMQSAYVSGAEIVVRNLLNNMSHESLEHFAYLPKGGKNKKCFLGISAQRVYVKGGIKEILRKYKIDLLYFHTFKFVSDALAAIEVEVPVVYHAHNLIGSTHPNLNKRQIKKMLRLIYLVSDRIICVSSRVRKDYSFIEEPNRVDIVRNAVNAYEFSGNDKCFLKKRYGIADSNPVVGMIARVEPRKNVLLFLRAAKLLRRSYPEAVFFIIGEAPKSKYLDQVCDFAKKNFPAGRVEFTGFLRDLNRIIGGIDVLVMPSSEEGMPIAMLEAMAAGKAVIGVRKWGEEFIAHGRNGLLINSPNVNDLFESVKYLLGNERERLKMGAKAREMIRGKFNIGIAAKRVGNILLDVLKNKEKKRSLP